MNTRELAQLLAFVAMGDNRSVDEVAIAYWEKLMPRWITYDLAERAVIKHRLEQPHTYLEPGDILAIADELAKDDETHRPPPAELTGPVAPRFSRAEWLTLHPEDAAVLQRLPTIRTEQARGLGRMLDRHPVDYGALDLADPAIGNAAMEDHRRGITHPGLPCCEPERGPDAEPGV